MVAQQKRGELNEKIVKKEKFMAGEGDMIEILNVPKNVNYYICHIYSVFNPKKDQSNK